MLNLKVGVFFVLTLSLALSAACGGSTAAEGTSTPANQVSNAPTVPAQCAGGTVGTAVADGPDFATGVVATAAGVSYWFPAGHDAEACQCAGCERASCSIAESAPTQATCNAAP